MKSKIFRAVAIVATASILSFPGAGHAAASPIDGAPGTGSGSVSTASAESIAEQLELLRDVLVNAVESADLSAVTGAVEKVESLVNGILGAQRFAQATEVMTYAGESSAQMAELRSKLADPRIAGAPDPLAILNGLIQQALDTLSGLIDSILGSAPALPDPGLPAPGLPAPGLPDPGLPAPGLPDPGLPDPGLPDPGLPDPGLPDPGVPDPGLPDPGVPVPLP